MAAAQSHLLLIDCDDQKGIVHQVTGILFRHGLNVDDQAEFVEQQTNRFFMRTEVSGAVDSASILKELRTLNLSSLNIRLTPRGEKRIVVFVGKEPHCLGDLLIRHAFGDLNARILAVVSNHQDLAGLIGKFDVPFLFFPHKGKERSEHEMEILEALRTLAPEYLVLAKYMRLLSSAFVAHYPQKIINIHHSFLPAFVGAKPYHQAFERGVKIIGATAHFVTEELDDGPIIAQGVTPTAHNKSPAAMVRAGRDVETVVLAKALRLVFDDRVFVHGKHTIVFD